MKTKSPQRKAPKAAAPAPSRTAFGPGKVILLGEHGVVYGHPALAAPLTFGVTARAYPSRKSELEIPAGLSPSARVLLEGAFARASAAVGKPKLRVTVESALPVSMGLGSSGALAVAVSRLLLEAAGRRAEVDEVLSLAFAMEREFHGTPSGVDHTTSARGELIYYRRPSGAEVGLSEAVRSPRPLKVLVALAGAREGTKATVGALRGRHAKWPVRYSRVFAHIAELVEEGRRAIERGELESLGDLMNLNQGLLSALGLSSPQLEGVVHLLRGAGALGAKLTGAGGDGGAVIGLFPEPELVLPKLRRKGVQCFVSQVAGPVVF